jgi:hypothetical protein
MNFFSPSDVHFYRGGHTSVNFYNKSLVENAGNIVEQFDFTGTVDKI